MSPKLAERGLRVIARSGLVCKIPLRRLHYRFEQSTAGEFAVARAPFALEGKITRGLAVGRHRRGYNKVHAPKLAQCPPFSFVRHIAQVMCLFPSTVPSPFVSSHLIASPQFLSIVPYYHGPDYRSLLHDPRHLPESGN